MTKSDRLPTILGAMGAIDPILELTGAIRTLRPIIMFNYVLPSSENPHILLDEKSCSLAIMRPAI